jgi:Family of unknown function (DUF6093)
MSFGNMERIKATVEKYMLDEVTVTRYDQDDATVNTTTLAITVAETEIYSGKAMVTPTGVPYSEQFAAGWRATTQFEVGVPADTDPVLPNDVVVVTGSLNNEQMVGMELLVIGSVESGFKSHTRLTCVRREHAE